MSSPASLRRRLVDELGRSGAISSDAVRDAFLRVPREHFLPGVPIETVYRDDVVVTKTDEHGRAISSSSQPQIMARMLELLDLRPGQRVLEIGAGTGYNAALLKELVGPGGRVATVEVDDELARKARRALRSGGHAVTVVAADGREGHAAGAPYDRIVATVSASRIPRAWLDQLAEGGLLEAPLRISGAGWQAVATFRRSREVLESVAVVPGGFMPLRGEEGELPPALTVTGPGGLIVQLVGTGLASLSAAGRRRALALVLGEPRRRDLGTRFPTWSLGFYLGLELPERRLATLFPSLGLGLVAADGRSLAFLAGSSVGRKPADAAAAPLLRRRRGGGRVSWRRSGAGTRAAAPPRASSRCASRSPASESRIARRWRPS